MCPRLARSSWLALALVALAACTSAPAEPDGGPSIDADALDAAVPDDAPAADTGSPPDAGEADGGGGGCGPECPPGSCRDGVCVPPECCSTGFCPGGLVCDWATCGCVAATGCCATGWTCPTPGEICFDDCTCIDESDCRFWGCPDFTEICDFDTGECMPDTSCGDCGADRVCFGGRCVHDCWLRGSPCPDGLLCSESDGCVAPRCTDAECAAMEPPQRCEPTTGCADPCNDGSDWSWCTSMGGRCLLGRCVDDSCSANVGIQCNYRYDCCGNAVCMRDDESEPACPAPCTGEPHTPPRADFCRCEPTAAGCVDVWGGGRPFPPFPEDPGIPRPF